MLCEEAQIENEHFLDSNTLRSFFYDFNKRKVTWVSPQALMSSSLRNTVYTAVQVFAGMLRNGTAAVFDSPGGIQIIISGSSISKENFRTGNFIMRFTLAPNKELKGTITVQAHFYESGNATTNQRAEFSQKVEGGNDQELAVNVAKKLNRFLSQWKKSIFWGFDLLATEGIDKLRRKLPVTKSKINWRLEIAGTAAMQSKK
jgi:capping protein alpha